MHKVTAAGVDHFLTKRLLALRITYVRTCVSRITGTFNLFGVHAPQQHH